MGGQNLFWKIVGALVALLALVLAIRPILWPEPLVRTSNNPGGNVESLNDAREAKLNKREKKPDTRKLTPDVLGDVPDKPTEIKPRDPGVKIRPKKEENTNEV